MLLGFILFFFFCGSTVSAVSTPTLITYSLVTIIVTTTTTTTTTNTTQAPSTEMLSALEIVAKPDYPVAAGQEVHLYCNSTPVLMSVNWTWLHLQDKSWKEVGSEKELTLTKPEESGQYQCKAKTQMQMKQSQNYTVYIVSFPATVGEYLGEAAFALAIVIFVAIIAGVVWFVWQKHKDKPASSSTPNKSVPRPKAAPKACSPPADSDRDVYMNYTNTNPSYVDLNPAHLGQDNLYSTLS